MFTNSPRIWWSIGGGLVGLAALSWIALSVDLGRLEAIMRTANPLYLFILPLAVAVEQLVRAWKWRQLLLRLRPIGTLRLFGAIMAGYLANMLVPVGISPFVRSWLVGRLEKLKMSTVLATVAIDRFIDGIVFAGFASLVVLIAGFPDPDGRIALGLVAGSIGSLILFSLLLLALALFKSRAGASKGWTNQVVARLPDRLARRIWEVLRSFADGVVWPRAIWRQSAIVLASVTIKLISVTHLIWAGLAFGVLLRPADYLFLMVFLGFLIILSRLARIPGGFVVGGVFALGLLNVPNEEAVLMVATVQMATALSIAVIGAVALWRSGVTLSDLRLSPRQADEQG